MKDQPRFGFVAAATVLVSAVLYSQLASAVESDALEEIVVSARKVSENVQRIPVSITALNAAALKEHSVTTLNDVQYLAPNLLLKESAVEPQALTIAMRGQEQNDIPLTVDPSVGVYIDGLYYPRTLGLKGDLVDMDRVEVLRGPQGTLYGRNTTGGALSLYTANPNFDGDSGSLEASAGNYNAWNFIAIGNLDLSDTAALRIVVQRGGHSGYGENAADQQLESENSLMLRTKLLLKLGSNVEATLFANYQQNDAGGGLWKLADLAPASSCPSIGLPGCAFTLQSAIQKFGPGILAPGNPNAAAEFGATIAQLQSYIGSNPYRTNTTDVSSSQYYGSTVGADVKVTLSDSLTLRSITGYEKLNRANNFDTDGTPFDGVNSDLMTKSHYLSQELQLIGTWTNFNWLNGLYFGDERGTEGGPDVILPFLLGPENPIQFAADVKNTTYAVFSQANWEFVPTWRLTAGVRYSWDDREIISDNTQGAIGCVVPAPGVVITPPGASLCPQTFQNWFSAPSWLISLDHQFTDQIMGYAKVSHGYRSGGENFRGANTPESFSPFKPEYVTEYEAGAKTELFDRTLRLNADVFYDNYTDIQRSISIPTAAGVPTTVVGNAASAKIKGLELESEWHPLSRLTLSVGGGFTDAYYVSFIDPVLGNLTNLPFSVPKWTAIGSARYVQPVELGDLSVQADYHWQSAVNLTPQDLDPAAYTQPAYGLLNGRVSLHVNSINTDIAIYGKNLTNKEYFVAGESLEASIGFGVLVTGQPRIFGIDVITHFGK
jgi:iron complex outermembrane receptor protein